MEPENLFAEQLWNPFWDEHARSPPLGDCRIYVTQICLGKSIPTMAADCRERSKRRLATKLDDKVLDLFFSHRRLWATEQREWQLLTCLTCRTPGPTRKSWQQGIHFKIMTVAPVWSPKLEFPWREKVSNGKYLNSCEIPGCRTEE